METTPRKINFEYVFRPAYYYSRFAGLWTFSMTYDANGMIQGARIGFFDILWPICVICLNFTLAYSAYETFTSKRDQFAYTIRFIAENIFQMSCFLFVVIGIVLNYIHRDRLIQILNKLNTFDNEVSYRFFSIETNSIDGFLRSQISKRGIRFDYRRNNRSAWIFFMVPTFIALVLISIDLQLLTSLFESPLLALADSFGYDFFHFVSWISLEMSLIIFLRTLHERFTALNSLLR